MVTICTTSLTFSNSTFCPHSVFRCYVWISEQTAIISLHSINWLVLITETQSVYCAVGLHLDIYIYIYIYIFQVNLILSRAEVNHNAFLRIQSLLHVFQPRSSPAPYRMPSQCCYHSLWRQYMGIHCQVFTAMVGCTHSEELTTVTCQRTVITWQMEPPWLGSDRSRTTARRCKWTHLQFAKKVKHKDAD